MKRNNFDPDRNKQKLMSSLLKERKQPVCPYCTPTLDNLPLNSGTVDFSMLEIKIIGRGQVLRVRNLTPDGLFDGQDMVIIKYCPLCGRNVQTNEPAYTTSIPVETKRRRNNNE